MLTPPTHNESLVSTADGKTIHPCESNVYVILKPGEAGNTEPHGAVVE